MGATLSVAICTLGRSPHLTAAVQSALAQDDADIEIVVVDNDPASRRTRRVLAPIDDARLRVVDEPERGLSRARNRAVASASGDLLAFTDDDAIADPAWASNLRRVFDADPDDRVACVTGRVTGSAPETDPDCWFEAGFSFDKGDTPLLWCGERAAGADDLARLLDAVPGLQAGPVGPVHPIAGGSFGSGNNMAFRRDWLVRAGGFDEALGAGSPARGGEDLDIFRRVALDDRALVYQPGAWVIHHHRATLRDLTIQAYGYGSGMAASVTRYAMSGRAPLRRTLRALPSARAMLLDGASDKNADKPVDYPARLDWAERAGYLTGPVLAVIGTAQVARRRRRTRGAVRG